MISLTVPLTFDRVDLVENAVVAVEVKVMKTPAAGAWANGARL
jgi:hypothetical protein